MNNECAPAALMAIQPAAVGGIFGGLSGRPQPPFGYAPPNCCVKFRVTLTTQDLTLSINNILYF